MHTEVPSKSVPRLPVLAVLLSMGATGLGQIYCGKLAKGLTLFFLSFAFAPIIVGAMERWDTIWALVALIAAMLLLFSVFIYAMVDAYCLAKRVNRPYHLQEYNRWYIYLLFILVSLAYPTSLAHTIREQVVEAYKIPSASMAPNILPGDHVLLNKSVYKKQSPRVGEIVIFPQPNARHMNFLKRIVALPGDTLEIRNHVLWINGRPIDTEVTTDSHTMGRPDPASGKIVQEANGMARYSIQYSNQAPVDYPKIIVPNGHCFVLGDNRSESKDSRDFGPVPLTDIKGRVDFIYFPVGSWDRFGRYQDR
jgi:signal peptidase I